MYTFITLLYFNTDLFSSKSGRLETRECHRVTFADECIINSDDALFGI